MTIEHLLAFFFGGLIGLGLLTLAAFVVGVVRDVWASREDR